MKKRKIAIIGLILPLLPFLSYACLVLISFADNRIGSIIPVDKLILLTLALLLVTSVLGTAISIIALLKSETETAPLVIIINIVFLLIILVFFRNTFFTEFKLII